MQQARLLEYHQCSDHLALQIEGFSPVYRRRNCLPTLSALAACRRANKGYPEVCRGIEAQVGSKARRLSACLGSVPSWRQCRLSRCSAVLERCSCQALHLGAH